MHRRTDATLRSEPYALRMVVFLAIIALFCRALIPAGYMPSFSADRPGRVELAFCASSGPLQPAFLEVPGKPADSSSSHADAGADCPFGILASQAAVLHAASALGFAASPAGAVEAPMARRTLPPLPSLGPPLGSRAPPPGLA